MRNGICPKCGAATVHSKADGLHYGFGKGRGSSMLFIRASFMTMASPAIVYICTTCGYFENYIADPGKLAKVAKNWQKVSPREQ